MKRILVVEDEDHLAIGIKYNLEAEGYDVDIAGDGRGALERFESDPQAFDLVILDLMLPGMSGYAVCESLRERGNQVPVLMLSARTLVEDRIRGYDVGADQYLQKPFELDELLSMTRNLLARRSRAKPSPDHTAVGATYEFGRATINFDTFEVGVAGEPVRLTHTEMKLLRYFVENEGLVVTRRPIARARMGHEPHAHDSHGGQFHRELAEVLRDRPGPAKAFPERSRRRLPLCGAPPEEVPEESPQELPEVE